MTRRQLIVSSATSAAAAMAANTPPAIPSEVVERFDSGIASTLERQVTEPASRWCGGAPDAYGLYWHATAGGILASLGTAFLYSGSRYHLKPEILERMRLAAAFLHRYQSADGNIDNPITNFNSPPDTAFMATGIAPLGRLAKQQNSREVMALVQPVLEQCGKGLAFGGVHTPNHRWVVCQALSQIDEVLPRPEYARRIDQWLAESIDIDSDGQYTERSTTVYDPIVDRALIVIAHKRGRPQLLDPVRRNLDSLLYLLHPNFEAVTEISRRQDQYLRAGIQSYWFSLQYMAARDNNGIYSALAAKVPQAVSLPALLEYPEMIRSVAHAPIPDNYEKQFPSLAISRIRRGPTSATVILGGSSRFFTVRRGDAILTAIRFSSAFFGKGQFVPTGATKSGAAYSFTQELSAGYWQPLEKPRQIPAGDFAQTKKERRVTQLCHMKYAAAVTEQPNGFHVRIQAEGTKDVPLTIELAFAPGGKLEGCEPVKDDANAFLMRERTGAYRAGSDTIRFGPMLREHSYVTVRGSEPRIPGQQNVYLTALTPVDHTIEFEWA
jgi:hypothetical protein